MKYYDPKQRKGFNIFKDGIPRDLAYAVFFELDELKDIVSISKKDFDNKLFKMTFGILGDEFVNFCY